MPDILDQFLTMPMIAFCLVIWALVFIQRKGLETAFPGIKEKAFWKEFLVPVGPLGTGAILAAVLSMYPFPEMFVGHWTGRAILGVICGMGSGLVHRVAKKMVFEKFFPNVPEASGSDSNETP